jgi:DNA topoisomerase VI subunit A
MTNDQKNGCDRLCRDFIRQFAGMKQSEALKAVAHEAGITRATLSSLRRGDGLDSDKTRGILSAMQDRAKPPKPDKLGCIGRSHIEEMFNALDAVDLKYKKVSGEDERGLPYVVEAAFAELTDEGRAIISGLNFSPAIHLTVVSDLNRLLAEQRIDQESNIAFLLHISTIAPNYLNLGKSTISPTSALAEAIEQCTRLVTSEYCKRRKREEREESSRERQQKPSRKEGQMSLKDAVILVLPQAIEDAGGSRCEVTDRDIYYAARELIQEHTSKRLTQGYFDQILDQWEEERGEPLKNRYRDARGYLLEPHTGQRIPLGTKAVDDYEIPLHLYDTILYFEKKGLIPKIQLGQIAEKYDCAIMASEGYATRAAKALIDAAQGGHKMKVLCFHDADPYGYNIARTLSQATGAHSYNIEIIDAGLSITEAVELGLATETFDRTKKMPKGLKLTDAELKYFKGIPETYTKRGKERVRYMNCRRVELNALSVNIDRFIAWIEGKLRQHGVAKKLVPDEHVVRSYGTNCAAHRLESAVRRQIERKLDLAEIARFVTASLADRVKIEDASASLAKWSVDAPPEPWTDCVMRLADEAVASIDDEIATAVTKALEGTGDR